MDRLATGTTEVVTDEVLPFGVRSVNPAGGTKVALLVKLPLALPSTRPRMVKVMVEPEGKVGTVAATALPTKPIEAGQTAPPVEVVQSTVMALICAGTVSVNAVPPAALGPLLVSTIEYSIKPPALTDDGPVLRICRSAAALIPVVAVAESLVVLGS